MTTPGKPNQRRQATGASLLQRAKSEATRIHVLNKTIDCLALRPASDVSVALIAKRAKVSRGGMQYHFKTRMALLSATIEHLHRRRLQQFRDDLASIRASDDLVDHIIDTHWKHLNEKDFRAYQELVLAARSDSKLARVLAPKYQAFLHEWYETARNAFGWQYMVPEVARAGNIAHYILDGMAYGNLAGQLSSKVIDDLIEYAKSVMRAALSKSMRDHRGRSSGRRATNAARPKPAGKASNGPAMRSSLC